MLRDNVRQVLRRWGPLRLGRYALEAFALYLVFGLLRLMPLDAASALGGFLGRSFGSLLGVNRTARANLALALPGMGATAREKTLKGMWDNLGRTMAEYPHLRKFHDLKRFETPGLEKLLRMRDDGRAGLSLGAHLGNWELGPIVAAAHAMPVAVVYRAPNNPFTALMLDRARRAVAPHRMPKGQKGGMALLRYLREGGHVGMLVDQKLREGLRLKFFGHDAMTAAAPAQWALRWNLPIVMTHVTRTGGARFRITFEDLPLPEGGNTPENVARLAQAINDSLEAAIRLNPDQYLWLHDRWGGKRAK